MSVREKGKYESDFLPRQKLFCKGSEIRIKSKGMPRNNV